MDRFEQMVRRARSLLYFVDEEEVIRKLRLDTEDDALVYFVFKAALILYRHEEV